MDLKSNVQAIADTVRFEALNLVHSAERRLADLPLKSFIGCVANRVGDVVQHVADRAAEVNSQNDTDFSDYPGA